MKRNAAITSLVLAIGIGLGMIVSQLFNASTANTAAPAAEANKALARSYIEQAMNGRRLAMIDAIVTPNFKHYVSPIAAPLNLEAHKKRLAGFFAAFPDLRFEISELVAEGDRVAWRLTSRGTHQGPLPGIPPTGKKFVGLAYAFIRIEDGKILEYWGGPDTWITLQQLGVTLSAPKSP